MTETEALPTLRIAADCDAALATLCDAVDDNKGVENKFAVAAPDGFAGLTNPLAIAPDPATTSCGFAGGCLLSVAAKGLKTSVVHGRAEIKVCGRKCNIDAAASTSDEVKCELPSIQSTASLDTFTIDPPGAIMGSRNLYSSADLNSVAFDGKNFPVAENTGAGCYIGTEFEGDSAGHMVGILNEVKFFIDYFPSKAVYSGTLKL